MPTPKQLRTQKRRLQSCVAVEDVRHELQQRGFLDMAWMRALLERLATEAASHKELARRFNITQSVISYILKGARPVSPRVAEAMGFRRVKERYLRYRSLPTANHKLTLTADEFRAVLAEQRKELGIFELSRRVGSNPWSLASVIKGTVQPSTKLAAAYGLYRDSGVAVGFVPIEGREPLFTFDAVPESAPAAERPPEHEPAA